METTPPTVPVENGYCADGKKQLMKKTENILSGARQITFKRKPIDQIGKPVIEKKQKLAKDRVTAKRIPGREPVKFMQEYRDMRLPMISLSYRRGTLNNVDRQVLKPEPHIYVPHPFPPPIYKHRSMPNSVVPIYNVKPASSHTKGPVGTLPIESSQIPSNLSHQNPSDVVDNSVDFLSSKTPSASSFTEVPVQSLHKTNEAPKVSVNTDRMQESYSINFCPRMVTEFQTIMTSVAQNEDIENIPPTTRFAADKNLCMDIDDTTEKQSEESLSVKLAQWIQGLSEPTKSHATEKLVKQLLRSLKKVLEGSQSDEEMYKEIHEKFATRFNSVHEDVLKTRQEKLNCIAKLAEILKKCEGYFADHGFCCGENFKSSYGELQKCTICDSFFHTQCRDMKWIVKPKPCDCTQNNLNLSKCRASLLKETNLSRFMQEKINKGWKNSDMEELSPLVSQKMIVRVVTKMQIDGQLGTVIDNFFKMNGKEIPKMEYTHKMILVFYEDDNEDVLISAMIVHEYNDKCPAVKKGCVSLAYIQSVSYIREERDRRHTNKRIILSYFDYARQIGYQRCHFWACPPNKNEDYLFRGRPQHQIIPDQRNLCSWYDGVLDLGKNVGIIQSFGSVYTGNRENDVFTLIEDLTFDGGYFTENIRSLKTLKNSKSKRSTESKQEEARSHILKEINEADKEGNTRYITFAPHNHQEGTEEQVKIEDEDPNCVNEIASSKEKWFSALVEENLDFSTLRSAKYSTTTMVRLLLEDIKNQNSKRD